MYKQVKQTLYPLHNQVIIMRPIVRFILLSMSNAPRTGLDDMANSNNLTIFSSSIILSLHINTFCPLCINTAHYGDSSSWFLTDIKNEFKISGARLGGTLKFLCFSAWRAFLLCLCLCVCLFSSGCNS